MYQFFCIISEQVIVNFIFKLKKKESHFYKVKRYGPEFSKEKFLSTLKLVEKVKIIFLNNLFHFF